MDDPRNPWARRDDEAREEETTGPPGQPGEVPWHPVRHAFPDDGLPGQPLSELRFVCATHGEEKIVEYYDPAQPPRCSAGDPMTRAPQ
ncbi:hypothetical protein FH609_025655 [Streptomyces sp. 3MP-14]|uniref:Uncharacterized protein n=1 Tax=Streptomyces mimosae TaxID=2586635 RepID=A0A5N5ZZS5_9ACTN|nr:MULTISPECIES: hypothetical protein [Streptomyces]KAB8161994.1 hypothetical protein FH607_023305 [Streptomyces mimosae]KAB8173692.1 hypothetical protein FH609_025655 [Streptomyces sp. 3MP-14]